MAILTFERVSVGGVGVSPGDVRLVTTDDLDTVTTAGYISNRYSDVQLTALDIVKAIYSYNATTGSGTFDEFTVTVSNGVYTLVQWANPGEVLMPVIDGNIPMFNGTAGQIKDSGAARSSAQDFFVMTNGSVSIGDIPSYTDINGTVGTGFAPTSAQTYVVTSAGTITSGNVLAASDVNGTISDSSIAANKVLTSSITNPDTSIDLISFDVTVGFAALATGGSVILITSSGSKQYKIRSLQLNAGGTNFSGGGGDRLGSITDGTTVYSLVPAATMQSLDNAQWGVTELPNPSGAAINTSTAAGVNLVFKYSGGTADYAAGSLVITGIAQRVA